MSQLPPAQFDPADVAIVQQVQQYWNAGSQPAALDLLRARAQSDAPWASSLMAWLTMQQGQEGMAESVKWAIHAARLGSPGQAIHTLNNLIAHTTSFPYLSEYVPELLEWAIPWTGGSDLVGQGWNLVSQGQAEIGLTFMAVKSPWPIVDSQMNTIRENAQSRLFEIEELTQAAHQKREIFETRIIGSTESITKAENDLTTSAKQAGLLVTTVLSDATNTLYKADASRNEKESKGAWISGLIVLGIAATAAVLPVGLHYFRLGPDYSTAEVIGVHLASTATLGTFAGVLLARARSRDRAAQRAHDLSTAMGTMISYSNQISNPVEKERFMMTMGQVVMQAHLSTGSGSKSSDDSLPGILALTNAMRSTNPPSSAPFVQ